MLKKLDKYVMILTYIYLILPVTLFALGWLNLPLAIILTVLSAYGGIKAVKGFENYQPIKISTRKVILAIFIVLGVMVWVYMSGVGGFSFQNDDFELRNVMLHDLTDLHWPVHYNYPSEPKISDMSGHQGALVYYFTYWLPAAAFGKLTGWGGANLFLYFWTVLGILLCFYWFARNIRKWPLMLLLLFILWSGMDAAGQFIQGAPFPLGEHIEWWFSEFQYSSNTTALFWVFNQTVVPWIIVMLFLNRLNKKSVLFTYALCVPYAPFSFIGLAPFAVYYLLSGKRAETEPSSENSGNFKTEVKVGFKAKFISLSKALWHVIQAASSWSNCLIAPIVIGIFLLFYRNTSGHFAGEFIWPYHWGPGTDTLPFLYSYLLFCLLEFGIYALLIAGKFKKEPVFLIAVTALLLIPSYQMGINNDFVMRVSIPSLIFLMVFVAKFLTEPIQGKFKNGILKFLLVGFLLIGAITPFNEIYRSVTQTWSNPQGIINDRVRTLSTLDESKAEIINVFVAKDPRNTFFFKYLGGNLTTGNRN